MKYLANIIFFVLLSVSAMATHNRAGEITYRQISEFEFEVTIITYTFTLSPADRSELEVDWGDNKTSIVPRVEEVFLPNYYKRNRYVGRHVYPGIGTYVIVVEDPNRNLGVQNIPNSVEQVFSIKTIMNINPKLGFNNTPILLNPPVDKAAVGRIFIHNPAAYDPDGDSLSYKLTKCTGENGLEIEGYTLPAASHQFYINETSGDLVWDAPITPGIYNVAIFIEEWRNGHIIGKIDRDMQIEVFDTDNLPPVIEAEDEYCVVVDSILEFNVVATDIPQEKITLTANGGPFYLENSTAEFSQTSNNPGIATGTFRWFITCDHVRKQPYQVVIKAQDNNQEVSLVALKNIYIKAIAPAVKNLVLSPTFNSIALNWWPSYCSTASGYSVYRKIDSSQFTPAFCQTGIPDDAGFTKIADLTGHGNTNFIDNNNGAGLVQGYNYCYRVVANFPDGAQSIASEEVCTELVRGIPVITNVSIKNTDTQSGSVYLAWSKPTEFDTIAAPGPYKYLIYRSADLWGTGFSLIDSTAGINDTIYNDTLLNTKDNPVSYKVEFYNNTPGNRFLIGHPGMASSVFLKFEPSDNKLKILLTKNVPWQNQNYTIFRKNELTQNFDSIGVSDIPSFIDSNLTNGKTYCYKTKSTGSYGTGGYVNPIINFSQINCGIPIDTTPPCAPNLAVKAECDSLFNFLSWNNPNDSCANDVVKYKIYYAPTLDAQPTLLNIVEPAENTTYKHFPAKTMAGCYYIAAVDSFANESRNPRKICVDNCSYFELPNVFTPNDDNNNDLLKPVVRRFIDKLNFKVYDRWGMLIFETTDPDINWDGKNQDSKKLVPAGVYYYICDVFENRLTGEEHRAITGFVHVSYDSNKSNE